MHTPLPGSMWYSVVQVHTSSVHVFLIFFVFFAANIYHTHSFYGHFPAFSMVSRFPPHPDDTTQTVTAMKLKIYSS